MNMKNAMTIVLTLLLSACGGSDDTARQQLDKVSFNMAWLPQGSMSGVIVAIDKGFFAEQGLEVEAMRGFGGIRTVNELDQGMFEFGYGDPLAVILNRVNGGKTRMIGAINNRWPAGLCFVKERFDINTPEDLKGLVVGGGQNSPMQVIVPAWLERNGVPAGEVNMMQLDPAVVSTSLIEGKIDAGECWLGNSLPIFRKRAAQAGVTIDWIQYSDFNLDIYGNGLVTSEKMISENPELVRRFLAATYRGYDYALAHQDEAVDIMLKHYPVLDREVTAQQLAELAELMSGSPSPGWLDAKTIGQTLSFLSTAYDVEGQVEVADIYTTDFLAVDPGSEPE